MSAVAWDTRVVYTQALMMSKACLSQPCFLVPVLGIPTLVSPVQRSSSCSSSSLRLGRPGASGFCPCYLPSHIRGGSCSILIPVGTGAIQSNTPSLRPFSQTLHLSCSERSWSAWQLGRRPHGSSRDRAPPSGRRRWDWTEMQAPGRVSSQQTPEKPHSASDSPCPLPSMGLILSPQRHRVALRRGRQEGRATAWGGQAGWGLQRN